MKLSEPNRPRRLLIYVMCAAFLTVLGIALQSSEWKGSAQLHTLVELSSTILAAIIGVIALILFHSKRQNVYLFVGAGFCGVACLDGLHTFATSSFCAGLFPSGHATLTAWSWTDSRTLLALLMVASWWTWQRQQRLGSAARIQPLYVYAVIASLAIGSCLLLAFVPLPRAYFPELFFSRPEELLAGVLFLVALVGYLQKATWQDDQFENWLVVSLVFGLVCQAVVMSRSVALFDVMFDFAHVLKVLSYLCVLIGLFVTMRRLCCEAQESREVLAESYAIFQQEAKRLAQSQSELVVAAGALQQRKEEAEAAQAEAWDQAARVQAIVECATDAIITIDSTGIIETFNGAAETIFGYSAEEAIGENITLLMPAPYREEHDGYLSQYLKTGVKTIIGIGREVVGKRKDGSTFPLELAVSEVKLKGRRLFTGIIRDITQRKLAEQRLVSP